MAYSLLKFRIGHNISSADSRCTGCSECMQDFSIGSILLNNDLSLNRDVLDYIMLSRSSDTIDDRFFKCVKNIIQQFNFSIQESKTSIR